MQEARKHLTWALIQIFKGTGYTKSLLNKVRTKLVGTLDGVEKKIHFLQSIKFP
jgi:hypothetical protein